MITFAALFSHRLAEDSNYVTKALHFLSRWYGMFFNEVK